MTCDLEKLSALTDGDLDGREARRVREHLEGCAACRAEHEALLRLKRMLAGESAHAPEPKTPDGEAWAALAARLGPTPAAKPARRWAWLLLPLAGAAAAAVIAVTWRPARPPSDEELVAQAEREFRDAEARYRRAVEKLDKVSARAREAWSSDERRRFDQAHASLAAAVEQCAATARTRPADPEAEELVFAAYRKQIGFLQDALLRAEAKR